MPEVQQDAQSELPFLETEIAISAVCIIAVAILVGKLLHYAFQHRRSSFVLPAAVTAGGLCLGLQLAGTLGDCELCASITQQWDLSLDILVNCVCAALFFSFDLIHRPFKRIWHEIIIQLMFGQVVSWGQYAVATATSMLFVAADPDKYTPYMGTIVASGMESGQKCMWNLYTKGAFEEVHKTLPDAYAYSVAAANVGLLSSIGVGVVLLSWKKVWDTAVQAATATTTTKSVDLRLTTFKREKAQKLIFESLSVHLGIICLAVGVSFAISMGLECAERAADTLMQFSVFSVIPIYPLCMLTATVLAKIFSRCSSVFLNLGSMQNIAMAGLEFIVAIQVALASFPVLEEPNRWTPVDTEFYVVCLACFLWNFFCLGFVSRRMCPNFWFARGLVEFGQSTGTFWVGLLFAQHLDPRMVTPVPLAFTVKQLVHGSVMGGGLFTSFALVLEHKLGPWMNFGLAVSALVLWTTVFCLYYRRKFPNHTHINLKEFNRMLRAAQQRRVKAEADKKQKKNTNNNAHAQLLATQASVRGTNSMLPTSLFSSAARLGGGGSRRVTKADRRRGVGSDGRNEPLSPPAHGDEDGSSSSSPLASDVDLEGSGASSKAGGGASVSGIGVQESLLRTPGGGTDLHFFVENPVEVRGASKVMKPFHIASIRAALASRFQLDNWTCLYNLQEHGASITQCLQRVKGRGPTVLVMEDTWGFVSGVFISGAWIDRQGWFGDGETFCFAFEPRFRTFPWQRGPGGNENFVSVDPEHGLGFGSGGGGFALWFDPGFENASTAKGCATFGNDQLLASSAEFGCITVEVWELGR